MTEEQAYTTEELLTYQMQRLSGDSWSALFTISIADAHCQGKVFENLVDEFREQNLPIVSASPWSEIRYADRKIPAPARIFLGPLDRSQIESLQREGFQVRPCFRLSP